MTSEESYNINDEHSIDDFDPEDSGPYNFRKKPQRNYSKTQPQNHGHPKESKRETRASRNPTAITHTKEDNYNLTLQTGRKKYAEHQEIDQEQKPQPEEISIFSPSLDTILNRKWTQNNEFEYLVKFKNKSHLHTEWMNESDLINLSKAAKGKINRFVKLFQKKQLELELAGELLPEDENILFDQSLIEVERILHSTQIFTVVHHKKSNEIKGKWSESLTIVCRKLLNYIRDHLAFGVYFMEPVNVELYPNYKKMIAQPMDLGTILNRLYLEVYTKPQDCWRDIGLVWRNCRKFNEDPNSDIRILCETLREASIWLYEQWHALSLERFNAMKEEFYEKYPHLKENIEAESKNEQEVSQKLASSEKPKVENVNSEVKNETEPKVEGDIKMEVEDAENKQGENVQKMEVEESPKIEEGQVPPAKLEQNSKIQNVSGEPSASLPNPPVPVLAPVLQLNQVNEENKSEQPVDDDQDEEQQINSKHEYQNAPSSDPQQVDEYLQNNVFLEEKKAPLPFTFIDLMKYDPGELSYVWLNPDDEQQQKDHNSYAYIDQQDAKQLNLNAQTPQLFLVKWKGVSYLGATWEIESDINNPSKIQEFRMFNKALDKESRSNMLLYSDYHEQLAELIINPKKKYKLSNSQIDQMSNILYSHDIACRKSLPKYNEANKPKLKNGRELRSYQVESLNWMIEAWYHRRNVILADEMGLGKTVQSISLLNHMFTMENRKGPFLVLAPLTTLEHWKRTVDDWTNFNSICYYDTESHAGRASLRSYEWFYTEISTKGTVLVSKNLYKVNIIISSYQVFLSDFEVFRSVPIQFIIVDEAHRLKNQNAKILTCLKTLPCKRVLLLTGTPIQNNTDELWTLLNYLEPNSFPRHSDFRADFGNLKTGEQVERLNMVLKPYMLRRMKQDVEQSIPPLHETIVDIEMTTIQKTIYRALYERNKGMLMKGIVGSNVTTSLNNLEIQLRKCCNHPFLIKEMEAELLKDVTTQEQRITKLLETSGKMTLVDKLLAKFRKEKKKMLIFSQFTYMLTLLEDLLKYRGIKYEKIDGQTKAKERQVAIDRYNNPTRNRQIFLLSTKAGGVGINLTSANIVIIFDSDWNPQNDVQATARAHRIGQQSEVKVFRLITDKTYESQMFQRAVLKLGLDQAIFKGGDFKGSIKEEGEGKNESKNNKEETEILLKMGILGLIKDAPESENNNFYENDIDEILAKNSREAEYSLIKGSYSFDKKKFVSSTCDKQLQLNDPDFWEKVLKNIQTQSQKLSKKMQNAQNYSTPSQQQQIMKQLSECVSQLLNSKVSTSGYNEDDEKTLTEILTLIMSEKSFSKPYRDLAHQWCSDLGKPSRRFKKATLDMIDATKMKNKRNTSHQEAVNNDDVFVDSDKESEDFNQEPKVFASRAELDDEKKDEYIKKLCYLCEKPKCSLFCQGYCKRAFHKECKRRVDEGEINYDGPPANFQPQELKLSDEQLKDSIDYRVVCQDCSQSLVLCFLCKKKGKYHGAEYIKKKNALKAEKGNIIKLYKKANEQGADDDVLVDQDPAPVYQSHSHHNSKTKNQVTKCSTANCAKFYHHACIDSFEGKVNFKALDDKSLHFRCSLHYCNKCGISGDTMSITQCIRCPKAYHLKCMDKDKTIKMTKKLIICEKHRKKEIKKQTVKAGLKEKEEKKHKAVHVEKEEVEDPVIEEKYYGDTRQRTRTTARGRGSDVVPAPIHTFSSKKYPPTNYVQMNITRPTEFDYTKYTQDWCRYCGSRFSSNFTQGPWGPKTLCTVHYISWKTKKTLILDDYPERPIVPINPSDDQELKYINNNRAKGGIMDYKEAIENGMM